MIAIDPGSGAVRWRADGFQDVLTGLGAGVLVNGPDRVVALDDTGAVRWSLPSAFGSSVTAIRDPARRRVVVQGGRRAAPRVADVDASTGAIRWRTGAGSRLLSVGRSGLRYLADGATLRAVRPSGAEAWRLPLAATVHGALELADGTVVVSSGRQFAGDGLLVRVDPRRAAPAVGAGSVRISRRTVRVSPRSAAMSPQVGAVLSVRMPRDTRISTGLRAPSRLRAFLAEPPPVMRVPAGRSFVRLIVVARTSGSAVVTVRWREGGRARVQRIPIRVVVARR